MQLTGHITAHFVQDESKVKQSFSWPSTSGRATPRGRSLPATVRSVERGASVRSQRSARSAPELHQKEDRWKEPEQQHERKRKHREDSPRRSRKPARDDDKTPKKGVIMVCEPTYNWKIM